MMISFGVRRQSEAATALWFASGGVCAMKSQDPKRYALRFAAALQMALRCFGLPHLTIRFLVFGLKRCYSLSTCFVLYCRPNSSTSWKPTSEQT
jgi:hypothetical protein